MSRLDELLEQKKQIEFEIKELKEQEYQSKIKKNVEFRKSIPVEVKEWLLKNIEHQCLDCNNNDDFPNNGWNVNKQYAKCNRCALAEYFYGDDMDSVELLVDVYFNPITR